MWRKKDTAEIAALKERVDRLEVQMSSLLRSLGKGSDVPQPWQPSSRGLDLAAGDVETVGIDMLLARAERSGGGGWGASLCLPVRMQARE